MRSGANRQTGDRSHHFVRYGFSVLQISLALVLLIGAALLIQSIAKIQQVDPGIDAQQLLTVQVTMTGAAYETRERRVAFDQGLIEEMNATPGVDSTSAVSVNMVHKGWPYPFSRSDRPPPTPMQAYLDGSTRIDRFRSLLVGMFAIAASIVPAIRAMQVSPAESLRSD
ncbi:MAG: hypothetical protein ACI8UO_005813 [Verrucomicrobiales bacterium]|jgi:hypothetical protein